MRRMRGMKKAKLMQGDMGFTITKLVETSIEKELRRFERRHDMQLEEIE